MKSTTDVIQAVQNNQPVTETELKCALTVLSVWRSGLYFDLARAIAETEDNKRLSPKTLRGLKRAWEGMHENFNKDLETFIIGTSYDPTVSLEERQKRFIDVNAKVLEGVHKILNTKVGERTTE